MRAGRGHTDRRTKDVFSRPLQPGGDKPDDVGDEQFDLADRATTPDACVQQARTRQRIGVRLLGPGIRGQRSLIRVVRATRAAACASVWMWAGDVLAPHQMGDAGC